MEQQGYSRIVGLGAYLPDQRVTSGELMDEIGSKRFGWSRHFLSRCTGIKERRVADPSMQPSDLAIFASEAALKDANISAHELDAIIYCGIDRDWVEPSTAHRVQAELGVTGAMCVDVTNACLGSMNGVAMADMMIGTGSARNVLVCTGEAPTRITYQAISRLKKIWDKQEAKRLLGALTVGDAGGAMIIGECTEISTWKQFRFFSDSAYIDLCQYSHKEGGMTGYMLMESIGLAMIKLNNRAIQATYQALNWFPRDINKLFCHQIGRRPHAAMVKLASLEMHNAPITYGQFGNLTSASIVVNMTINRPNRGDKCLVLSAGSGLSICQAGLTF